jgi:hypothetical protein
MEDQQIRGLFLMMVKLFRSQQEQLLKQRATLEALQLVLARATGSTLPEMLEGVSALRDQIREQESDRAEREQVDAIVRLLEQGKHPDIPEA